MRTYFLFLCLLLVPYLYCSAQVRITGTVLDYDTHEPVPFSHIQFSENDQQKVVAATRDGDFNYYSRKDFIELIINVSHMGYAPITKSYSVKGDTVITIFLYTDAIPISEVIVEDTRINSRSTNIHIITAKDAGLSVSILGETDVIKPIRTLPGISQGIDGSMSLFVRGSNNGNNRIEMDGVPVYGSTHLFGLTSIFQTEMVNQVVFKMGGISAQNGNFLSSVTQVQTKSPLTDKQEYSLSVSPFILGAHAIVPFKSHSTGIVLGGRYSLLQQEINLIKRFTDIDSDIKPQVADGLMKLVWKPGKKSILSTTWFASNDYFGFTETDDYSHDKVSIAQNWHNHLLNMVWDYKSSSQTDIKTTVYYNRFKNLQKIENYTEKKLKHGRLLSSESRDFSLSSIVSTSFKKICIDAGIQSQFMQFFPAHLRLTNAIQESTSGDQLESLLTSVFVSASQDLTSRLSYQAGIRASYYQSGDYRHFTPDLRLSAEYLLRPNFGINSSYDQFTQFYHTLEGIPMGWSLDIMVPSYYDFPASGAHQLYSGIFWQIGNYHLNLGGYWKITSNIAGYTTIQNLFSTTNTTWEFDLDSGKGKSFGMEFMLNRRVDSWTWDIAYTLSKSTRQFPMMNQGQPFPFKFDRPHILNLQTERITRSKNNLVQSIFATVTLSSGHNTTLAIAEYPGTELPYWSIRSGTRISSMARHLAYHRQLMSEKNDYAMPAYFRIDVGYTFKRIRSRYVREFTLTCFNVTNHRNPYLYFRENHAWHQLTIFPILPSFRYKLSF